MIIQIQLNIEDYSNERELTRKISEFFRNVDGVNGILIEKYLPLDVETEDDDEWETILDRDEYGKVFVNDHRR